MKLSEIIERLDKSNDAGVDLEGLADELGVYESYFNYPDKPRIKQYYVFDWLCTDTVVGFSVLFFDEKPFCFCVQTARKNPVEYSMIEGFNLNEVKDYLLSLVPEQDKIVHETVSLDEELDEWLSIQFTGQLFGRDIVKYNDKLYKIDKRKTSVINRASWTCSDVVLDNGVTVPLSECLFRINIK